MKAPAAIWRVPMTESDLSRAVLDMARLFKWLPYHSWTSIHSAAGFPDWVFVRPPRVLFVELKSEVGKLTPAQANWIAALRDCPVEVAVIRPSDCRDPIEMSVLGRLLR